MKINSHMIKSVSMKIISIVILTLMMVIPINMVMHTIKEKQRKREITNKWKQKKAYKEQIIAI